jgi:hypothetical protein
VNHEATQRLRARSEALHAHYSIHFAGRPRATRDLVAADVLVSEANEICTRANAMTGDGAERLQQTARERLSLYEVERKAVLDAHAAGFDAARGVRLGTRANLVFSRYRRHFAGQDRRSRDLSLMDELIADCEALQREAAELVVSKAPEGLRKDLEIITENLALYRRERSAIIEARSTGTPEERGSALANLANRQFQLYSLHFAGQNRMSRREGLLERIRAELSTIADDMAQLSANGLGGEANVTNAGIVAERYAIYGKELEQLQMVHEQATSFQQLRAVEGAADDLLAEYDKAFAGQDRATRVPADLSLLCDRMAELERQFAALVERFNLGVRYRPAARVRDLSVMFEREYQAVVKAKLN